MSKGILYFLFATGILIFDVVIVYRNNRKRKFGIFPGYFTLILLFITGLFWFYTAFLNTTFDKPLPKSFKKDKIGYALYDEEQSKYAYKQEDAKRQIRASKPMLFLLLDGIKIQCIIALAFSLLGRMTVSGRNSFYHFLIVLYLAALGLFYWWQI
jgi:hypothetical protein